MSQPLEGLVKVRCPPPELEIWDPVAVLNVLVAPVAILYKLCTPVAILYESYTPVAILYVLCTPADISPVSQPLEGLVKVRCPPPELEIWDLSPCPR